MIRSRNADVAVIAIGLLVAALFGAATTVIGAPAALVLAIAPFAAVIGLRAAVRISVDGELATQAVIAGSLVLLSLPAVLPGKKYELAVLTPFLLTLAFNRPVLRFDRLSLVAALSFVVLVILGLLRGASAGVWSTMTQAAIFTLTLATMAAFALTLLNDASDPVRHKARLLALASAPGVFVIANLVLYAIGDKLPLITMPEQASIAAGSPASILRAVGFGSAMRVQLPLSSGVNAMGAIAAAGIVISGVLARHARGRERLWQFALIGACLGATALSDSRLALIAAAVVLVAVLLAPRMRAARGIAILLPLSPVIVLALLGSLADSQLSESLSRTGDDFATGTNRAQIWRAIWNSTLSNFDPHQLIGWGANGQVRSGAIHSYDYLFAGLQGTFTAHNVYIQTILDLGYIGLFALVAATYVAVRRLAESVSQPTGTALAGATLVLALCGITEALPSPYFPEVLLLFVMFLCTDCGPRQPSSRARSAPARRRVVRA